MSCQIYDWTQGGIWIYNNASFTAADLADNGIYGSFVLEGNLVELHQDALQRVDLRGNLTISAGQFKVYGGIDNSYWGSVANASLIMSNGVLDIVDQAINIQDVAPFSFISTITGGTIRTQKGMVVQSPGFNPDGGLVEIYGNQNSMLLSDIGGAFYNIIINKSDYFTRTNVQSSVIKNNFIIEEGLAEVPFGKVLECQGNISVNQGGMLAVTSGMVKMGSLSSININDGGSLASEGYEGAPSVFTIIEPPAWYAFNVNSGGDITVYHTVFENMNEQGINIAAGANVNNWKPFESCEFRNGKNGASTLLSINNGQALAIRNAIFPENTWSGTYNVSKTVTSGHVVFYNATGAFSGEAFDNDPNNLIDWVPTLTATATATPQVICAGSSSQLDVIREGGFGPFTYLWSPAIGLSDPAIINPVASPLITTIYDVTVTDALGQTAASNVTLTVNPLLPVSVTINTFYNPAPPGSLITFYATPINGGDEPSYQWKVNGADAGDDLATYSYYPLYGDEVTCVLTSSAPCVTGNPATSNTITMIMVPAYINVTGEILAGTDTCFNAYGAITVPPAPGTFTVYPGGSANFIAGTRIRFLPGATVMPGGYMHAWITETNEYCGSLAKSLVSSVVSGVADEGEFNSDALSLSGFFAIYPNPTSGIFTLLNKGEVMTDKAQVDIFDMRGDRVLTASYAGEQTHLFTVNDLSPGLYFLKVISGKRIESFKLIVTR
jgi:hypothetical protein